MGRELSTFVDFQKTLSQLGFNSGSVLVRLSYRKTDQAFHEAVQEIRQFFQEEEREERPTAEASSAYEVKAAATPDAAGDTPMRDVQPESTPPAAAAAAEPLISTEQQQTEELPLESVEDRAATTPADPYEPTHIFLAPSNSTPAAALTSYSEPDAAPSIAQAQQHQHRLQEHSRNTRLLSDKEIEEKTAAEEAKIAAVKSVLVRVRFPDNTTSEWSVTSEKTGAFLYEAVRRVMVHQDQAFRLVIPPGKTIIKDDDTQRHSLVKAYKLRGPTMVNFVWNDSVTPEIRKQQPFLKDVVARQGKAVTVPKVPEAKDEEPAPAPAQEPKKEEKSKGLGMKKPKWLQMGKK